ncbi:MAG: hypothetical protein R3Y35_11510 [Clostridia bacterium]
MDYITGLGMTTKEIKEYFKTDVFYICGRKNEVSLLFTEEGFENTVNYFDFSVPELRPIHRYISMNSRVCNLKRDDDFWVFVETEPKSQETVGMIYLLESKRKGCYYCLAKGLNNELSLDIDKAEKIEVEFGKQDLTAFDEDDDDKSKKSKPFLGSCIVPIISEE